MYSIVWASVWRRPESKKVKAVDESKYIEEIASTKCSHQAWQRPSRISSTRINIIFQAPLEGFLLLCTTIQCTLFWYASIPPHYQSILLRPTDTSFHPSKCRKKWVGSCYGGTSHLENWFNLQNTPFSRVWRQWGCFQHEGIGPEIMMQENKSSLRVYTELSWVHNY